VLHARSILCTLREGFETIRDEAANLERTGQLESADQVRMVSALA
jgi:hypothetical protein